jgi:hypothetical protein
MSSLIVPEEFKKKLEPVQLPFHSDADVVLDANGREICEMAHALETRECINFSRTFAASPEMLALLGEAYAMIAAIASNSDMDHGRSNEADKENCILCRMEALLKKVKTGK